MGIYLKNGGLLAGDKLAEIDQRHIVLQLENEILFHLLKMSI